MKWKELSWPLKVGVVGGWISVVYLGAAFIIGFVLGFLGAI